MHPQRFPLILFYLLLPAWDVYAQMNKGLLGGASLDEISLNTYHGFFFPFFCEWLKKYANKSFYSDTIILLPSEHLICCNFFIVCKKP